MTLAPARAVIAAAMTESALQDALIEAAQRFGWRVVHFRPARTKDGWRTPLQGDAGFVDVVLSRNGRTLHCELKTMKGKRTAEQIRWGDALGSSYRLWRPNDWLDGTIENELARVRSSLEIERGLA